MEQKLLSLGLSSLIAICFAYALYSVYQHWHQYMQIQQRSMQAQASYTALLAQQARKEKLVSYSQEANKINNLLVNQGFSQKLWTEYRVDIDKGVSFAELDTIISHARHGKNQYFIPETFSIQVADATQKSVAKQHDAYVQLKGYFLVRK